MQIHAIIGMAQFQPETLTWTGLLAQWVRFAQATLALPEDSQGREWRESVPWVINLQAVTFALADLEKLQRDERALALDKADMLIRDSTHQLQSAWAGYGLPESLHEIVEDARGALAAATELFSIPRTEQ